MFAPDVRMGVGEGVGVVRATAMAVVIVVVAFGGVYVMDLTVT